ncbi:unnamed protein product [Nippostrongylus brasiliensis]|uniref:Activin_recp domain-containing protein n=1 Tax=Nippostrongylus brasiliensis TaxID=27835 RepID=A0A158R1R8_NIPBR|nr:unnamed protein product [Nippostrongylus brasiliensis]
MDFRELLVYLVVFCSSFAEAIRCKCTKESETVTCVDGICEMEPGSCLMLDHPTLGVHYTCHNKLQKDGFCREKTSKSGALVKICGCNSDDFCNYSYWPDKCFLDDQSSLHGLVLDPAGWIKTGNLVLSRIYSTLDHSS